MVGVGERDGACLGEQGKRLRGIRGCKVGTSWSYCGVEKWSSRWPHKPEIVGSNPTPVTNTVG